MCEKNHLENSNTNKKYFDINLNFSSEDYITSYYILY